MTMTPLINLEKSLPSSLRKREEKILMYFMLIGICGMLGFIQSLIHIGSGIFFISLSLFVFLKMLDFWFATSVVNREPSFLATFFFNDEHPIEAFCAHPVSHGVMNHLGLHTQELVPLKRVRCGSLEGHPRNLKEFLGAQFNTNKEIKAFFEVRNVSKAQLDEALLWAERKYLEKLEHSIPLYKSSSPVDKDILSASNLL